MSVSLADLSALSRALADAGVEHALGGSGLLCALGLIELDEVGDWDVTTDAPHERVAAALGGYRFEHFGPTARYRSAFLLRVEVTAGTADVMGTFAIDTDHGLVRVPTTITGSWRGVPVGDPAAWERAYRAMGRPAKADLLARHALKP